MTKLAIDRADLFNPGRIRTGALLPIVMALSLGACSHLRLSQDVGPGMSFAGVSQAAIGAGMPDVALRVANMDLAQHPSDPKALAMRGDALFALGQLGAAEGAYEAALAKDPTVVAAHIGLGRIWARRDPAAAEAAFMAALRYDPHNVPALNNLGVVRDLQGRNTEAQNAYLQALSIAPNQADIQINLGRSYALSGRRTDALQVLSRVAMDPGAVREWGKPLASALATAEDMPLARQVLIASSLEETAPLAEAPRENDMLPHLTAKKLSQADPYLVADPVNADSRSNSRIEAVERPGGLAPGRLSQDHRPAMTSTPAGPGHSRQAAEIGDHHRTTGSRSAAANAGEGPHAASHVSDRMQSLRKTPFAQLASLGSKLSAFAERRRLASRFSDFLSGYRLAVLRADAEGKIYWRVRTFGFGSLQQASNLCVRLKAAGQHCWSGHNL